MIIFSFTINSSFLNESAHPITVPKSQVEYKAITAERFDLKNVAVVFPRGEKMTGYLYSGIAGYGSYYQLRYRRAENCQLT